MKTSDFLIKLIAGYDVKQKERQLSKDNANKKQELESAFSKIKELAAEIEALSLKQTNAEREIGNNKTTIDDLHAEKEDLISQHNSMSVKISEQAQEILSLRNLLNAAQQKNSGLQGHMQEVKRNLSTQNDKLAKELENAITNLKSSKSEEDLLHQKIAKLETTIEEQQREIEKKRVNEQSLNAKIKTLSEQLHLLEEEKEKYRVESEKIEDRNENTEQERNITRDNESSEKQIINQDVPMIVQNNVEQKQVESGDSHAELNETEDNENQFANKEPYIEEKVLEDNTPKGDTQQEEIKNANEIESIPVNDNTGVNSDVDATVCKSLQDNSKIADEGTESDCTHSGAELIPITDSEQAINNIVEEERAKADTDESKVATEESTEPVTEEISDSKLEEQKESIEEVHTSVRRIEKIFDTETEKEINAEEFFARPESELIKWREEFGRCIKFGEKRFLCPFCRQQIKIAGRKFERGHVSFFAHLHDSADCPIKTSVNMSKEEIEARKYGLCQESKRHKELKQRIYEGLNGEQSRLHGVDNVQIEKRINANIPYLNWRRPDVCATFKEFNVVFELQLSTTFLSTIVDRDIFYRLHHYFIIWIFNFEENVKYVDLSNLMMKDIYYTNKRNIFVFDREAREESEKRNELVLKCNWLTPENQWKYPVTDTGKGLDVSGKLITLSDLTFDETSGKVYYVDAEEDYYSAHPETREIEKRIENDRKQLLERWMAHVKRNNDVPDEQEMMELVDQMVAKAERAVIYKVDNRMGLMYGSRHLTAPQYSSIEAQGDYFLARYNRKTALYDQYGRQILPCEYLNIYQRENGLIFAESTSTWFLLFDDKIEKLCDRKPHDKITIQHEEARLEITIEHPNNGSETGYVLTDGINTIPFIYQSIINCKDGEHFIVCRNSLYGIYSKDLRLIIPIDYKSITPITNSQKCVGVRQDNAICLIDLVDAAQQALPYERLRLDGGNLIVSQQGKEGVIDANNKVIVPIAYQQCTAVANKYLKVKTIRDNAIADYGLYDYHGKQILQSRCSWIDYIGDDLFILKNENGKSALYNAACDRYVFGEKWFDGIKAYNNHTLFRLYENNKYALANLDGIILTPFKYDSMYFSYNGSIKVNVGESVGTLSHNGQEIYDDEITLRDGYIATSFFGKWNVMHDGKECLPRIYNAIKSLADDWVEVSQNGLWGISNLNGKSVLPIEYTSIILYEEQGYIVVSKKKDSFPFQNIYGILNMNLETVLPIICTEPIKPISKEYALVGSSTFGILAISSNKIIISTSYSDITLLTDRLFVTTKLNTYWNRPKPFLKYGLYDKSGKKLLLCEYDEIKLVTDNLVKLRKDSQYLIFRTSDQQTLDKQSYTFIGQPDKEGNIIVQGNDTVGYINSVGEPIYTDTETFDDGFIKTCFLGKYGLKSSDGTLVLDCELNDIRYLTKGVYAIKTESGWGVKSPKGKLLLACMYTSIEVVSDILLKVQSKGYYGYDSTYNIYNMATCQLYKETYNTVGYPNEKGQIPVTYGGKTFYIGADGTPIYYVNETINNAYAIVNRLDQYGVNSIDGSVLIPCMYRHVTPIKENLFSVQNTDYKWGIYAIKTESGWGVKSPKGKLLLACMYTSIEVVSDILLKVQSKGYYGYDSTYNIYNMATCQLYKETYNTVGYPNEKGQIPVTYGGKTFYIGADGTPIYYVNETINNAYTIVNYLGQYGVNSIDDSVLIPCQYENISHIKDNLFSVQNTSKKWGIISINGDVLLPNEYGSISMLSDVLLKIKQYSKYIMYNLSTRHLLNKVVYDSISDMDENGEITVELANRKGKIDGNGNKIYEKNAVGDGYVIYSFLGQYGIESDGTAITACKYDSITYLGNHYFILTSNRLHGLYLSNEQILPINYQTIIKLTNNLLKIKDSSGCQLYDMTQRKVITPYYQDIQAPDENTGMLTVSKAGKTGLINQQGEVQYTKKVVGEAYRIIEFLGEFGIADTNDKILCPCQYKQINHLYDHLFAVMSMKNKWGLYSARESKTLTEFIYDEIWFDKKNLTLSAKRDNKKGKLSESGEEIMNILPIDLGEHISVVQCFNYTGIKNTETNKWILDMGCLSIQKAGNYIIVSKGYKCILMDMEFNVLTEAEDIKYLKDCLFSLRSKNKWGLYSAKEPKVLTEFIYDEIWVDKKNSTLLAKRNNKTGKLSEKGEEIHNTLSLNLGENVSVIQCFDKVGIQNKETDEWLLPMKYQQFKKAGKYILFNEDSQWGLMDMKFHVLIEPKYKIMKMWNADIFVVAETQYKSYGYDSYPKTRYGIISASGITLLACNYVKIHIVNSKLVSTVQTMNTQATYYTVNNGTLQRVKREDLSQYIDKCTFKVNEKYEGVIINRNPYCGIFVEVKGEGIGCIPKAALPKDYMQNKNMKKGMPIKVEVTNINELNQVKFKLFSVR